MPVPPNPVEGRTPSVDSLKNEGPSSVSQRDLVAAQERREQELWRWCLLLLVLLAVALGAEFAQKLEAMNLDSAVVPAAVVILIAWLAVLVWRRRSRVASARRELVDAQSQQLAMAMGVPGAREFERLYYVLQRSQQGYRDLIDSFDDPVLAFSLTGEILAANRRVIALFGREFNEVVGRPLDEFLSEPSRAAAEAVVQRFEERRHWSGVVRVRLKASGEVRFFDCVLHAVVRDGRTAGVSCLARDVTQERQNEARFAELFNSLQEGVYFTTPEGDILDANPALARMLGYSSREELLKMNAKELFLDSEQRAAEAIMLEQQGRLVAREIVLKRRDGTRVTCLDTATLVRDAAGRPVRYQGILVDISARLEMERSLHEKQEFARRLIESFPDLIIVLDRDGKFTFVSNRIQEVLGFGPGELLGSRYGLRAHPDDRSHLDALVNEILSGTKTNDTLEYRTQHKDGAWRMLRATVAPIADSDGTITGLIASLRDVTELNRLEQQVMQSEKLAAMGQMIAGVAHELNNPLTAILAVSDMLREHTEDAGHKRQLELMHQQARRAADIVQDLLSFARPPAPRRGRVQLAEVLRRALHLHEYSLRRNNVSVDFLPEKALPDVLGDSNQLIQVFLNLVVNAEQAIREIRDAGTIRVRMGRGTPDEAVVWATIQDDGPGIPGEIVEKIFDPFFTTKRPGRGTGLGLSISMSIIREHGGKIEVQSSRGGGCIFQVTLPAAQAGEGEVADPATPSAAGTKGNQ